MENKPNIDSWIFGLEKFFQFKREQEKSDFIRSLMHLKYYNKEDRPWALVKLLSLDSKRFPEIGRDDRWGSYTSMMISEDLSIDTIFWLMSTLWENDLLIKELHYLFNHSEKTISNDLFSKDQVLSKIWMSEILDKFISEPISVLLVGGWYAQHRWYLNNSNVKNIVNVDLDSNAIAASTAMAEIAGDSYQGIVGDINDILQEGGTIEANGTTMQFDLVVNTSGEHMDETWFSKLVPGQRTLLQTNNMFGMNGHVNCAESLADVNKKYPLKRTDFAGQLSMVHGNRYMVLGSK